MNSYQNLSHFELAFLLQSKKSDLVEVAAVTIALNVETNSSFREEVFKQMEEQQQTNHGYLMKSIAKYLIGSTVGTRSAGKRILLRAARQLAMTPRPESTSSTLLEEGESPIAVAFLNSGMVEALCQVLGEFDLAGQCSEVVEHCCETLAMLALESKAVRAQVVTRGLALRLGSLLSESSNQRRRRSQSQGLLKPQPGKEGESPGQNRKPLRMLSFGAHQGLSDASLAAICNLLVNLTERSMEATKDLLQTSGLQALAALVVEGLPSEPEAEAVQSTGKWDLAERAAEVLLNCICKSGEATAKLISVPNLAQDLAPFVDQIDVHRPSKTLQHFSLFLLQKALSSQRETKKGILKGGKAQRLLKETMGTSKQKPKTQNTPPSRTNKKMPSKIRAVTPSKRDKGSKVTDQVTKARWACDPTELAHFLCRSGIITTLFWLLHHEDYDLQALSSEVVRALVEKCQSASQDWALPFIEQGCVAILMLRLKTTLPQSIELCSAVIQDIKSSVSDRLLEQVMANVTSAGNRDLRLNSASTLVLLALEKDTQLMDAFIEQGGLNAILNMMHAPVSLPKVFLWVRALVHLCLKTKQTHLNAGPPPSDHEQRSNRAAVPEDFEDILVMVSDKDGISDNIKMSCPSMDVIKKASSVLYKTLRMESSMTVHEGQSLPLLQGRYQVWEEVMSHIGALQIFYLSVNTYHTDFIIELCGVSFEYKLDKLNQIYFQELYQRINQQTILKIFDASLHCNCTWLNLHCWKYLEHAFIEIFHQQRKSIDTNHEFKTRKKKKQLVISNLNYFLSTLLN